MIRELFWGVTSHLRWLGRATVLVLCFVCASQELKAQADKEEPSGYLLGPDDQISLHVMDATELSGKQFLIGTNGDVTFPLIGRVHVGGLTVEELETSLDQRLAKYVKNPQVSVTVTDFRSQPVSVMGAVAHPGVVQLRGRKNLYEVLSMAGGPTENAGSTLTITRRASNGPIPLPDAKRDAGDSFSTAQLNVESIMQGRNPFENIEVKPFDTITVSQAGTNMIYVVGDVEHGGAFTLGERRDLSVLRALALAGGLGKTARPEKARILRPVLGDHPPQQIPVNVKQIIDGKQKDALLLPQDVLVVPTSGRKKFTTYYLPSMVSAAAYAAIYQF